MNNPVSLPYQDAPAANDNLATVGRQIAQALAISRVRLRDILGAIEGRPPATETGVEPTKADPPLLAVAVSNRSDAMDIADGLSRLANILGA